MSGRREYSPGRPDARLAEARVFVAGARHLRNLTAHGLVCQFNLKPGTAADILKYERARRGEE